MASLSKNTADAEVLEASASTVEKIEKPKKKRFKNEDEIECVSITPGQLFVQGERSKELYIFADIDDVQFIRFDDLQYMVRRKAPAVFRPRFIIHDKDFLDQNPSVSASYGALYSTKDMKNILKCDIGEMKAKLAQLPYGVYDSFKTLAATEISRGRLDSVRKIKVIDEFFGTNLLSTIADN